MARFWDWTDRFASLLSFNKYCFDSDLLKMHASRISDVLYLMHKIWAGLWSGLLLVKLFTTLSMFWRRLVYITSLFFSYDKLMVACCFMKLLLPRLEHMTSTKILTYEYFLEWSILVFQRCTTLSNWSFSMIINVISFILQ